MTPPVSLRLAQAEDLPGINEIYNLSIPSQSATADTEDVSLSARKAWFANHDPEHYPIYVATVAGHVVGWIALSPHRPGRGALRHTAEVSYYVHPEFQRQGIGSNLLHFMLDMAIQLGYRNLFAILLENNEGSIEMLKKYGFKQWGRLPNVADFGGVEVSQVYYGIRLPEVSG